MFSLTDNGRLGLQPILFQVQPILIHANSINWTEIVVQLAIMLVINVRSALAKAHTSSLLRAGTFPIVGASDD